VNSYTHFGIGHLNRAGRRFVLPWLVPTYLFIGSYAARTIIDIFENHLSIVSQTNDDPDGSNENGDLPYWTSHKHVSSDERFKTDTVALVEDVNFEPTINVTPRFSPEVPSISFVRFITFSLERAPPAFRAFA